MAPQAMSLLTEWDWFTFAVPIVVGMVLAAIVNVTLGDRRAYRKGWDEGYNEGREVENRRWEYADELISKSSATKGTKVIYSDDEDPPQPEGSTYTYP